MACYPGFAIIVGYYDLYCTWLYPCCSIFRLSLGFVVSWGSWSWTRLYHRYWFSVLIFASSSYSNINLCFFYSFPMIHLCTVCGWISRTPSRNMILQLINIKHLLPIIFFLLAWCILTLHLWLCTHARFGDGYIIYPWKKVNHGWSEEYHM